MRRSLVNALTTSLSEAAMRTMSATLTSPTRRSIPGASLNNCRIFSSTSSRDTPSSSATVTTQNLSFSASSHPGCWRMFSGASSSPMMSPSSLTLCAALLWYVFTLHGFSADFDGRVDRGGLREGTAWTRRLLAPADASPPSSSEEGPASVPLEALTEAARYRGLRGAGAARRYPDDVPTSACMARRGPSWSGGELGLSIGLP